MRIQNNLMAMNTQRSLELSSNQGAKSMAKLSSGYRINSAADDAAGLSISEKMRSQIRGLAQASRNAQDGISMIQTAEGALGETQEILQRMRELAVQSGNDTNTDADRGEIQREINQLTAEINRIGDTTEFNTQKLLKGGAVTTPADVTFTASNGIDSLSIAEASTLDGTYSLLVEESVAADGTAAGQGISNVSVDSAAALDAGTFTFTVSEQTTSTASSNDFSATATVTSADVATTSTLDGSYRIDTSYDATVGNTSFGSTGVTGITYNGTDNSVIAAGHKIEVTGSDGNWTVTILDSSDAEIATASGLANTGGTVGDFDVTATTLAAATDGTFDITGQGWEATLLTDAGAAVAGSSAVQINPSAATVDLGNGVTADFGATLAEDSTGNFTVSQSTSTSYTVAIADSGTYSESQAGILADAGSTTVGDFTFDAGTLAAGTLDVDVSNSFTATLQDGGVDVAGAANIAITENQASIAIGSDLTISTGAAITAGTISFDATAAVGSDNFEATLQIGSNQGQLFSLNIDDMRATALGVSGTTGAVAEGVAADAVVGSSFTDADAIDTGEFALDVSDSTKASAAITVIDQAVERVSAERSKLGAMQNRLEHTIKNLDTSAENMQSAESRIRDVDMAKEMMEFTKNNILQQAATAMLAQANQAPQAVLQLLR